ncbi:hypothetical protein LTS17_004582 [Exophiala oligosperma]
MEISRQPHHIQDMPEGEVLKMHFEGDDARLAQQGYKPELKRQLSFWPTFSLAICLNGAWQGLSSALGIGIVQGGPCAVIYGFIFTFAIYMSLSACVSELVSSMPTAAGPYYWVFRAAPPRWARVLSWYTGYINLAAQIFGGSSVTLAVSQQIFALIEIINPNIPGKRWQTFLIYEGLLLSTLSVTIFGNKLLKHLTLFSGVMVALGFFIITIVVPSTAPSHRSSHFVWAEWFNSTGWISNGIVFFIGLPNAFYGFGFLDTVVHLSEEIEEPERSIPRVIFGQYFFNLVTGLCFLLAMFYSIQDIDGILEPAIGFSFFELFVQAVPKAGAAALGLITILACINAVYEIQVVCSRLIWSFARDGAFPWTKFFAKVDSRFQVPVNAVLLVLVINLLLGLIFQFAEEAFAAMVGSSLAMHNLMIAIVLGTVALTGRRRIVPGPWHMRGAWGLGFYVLSTLLMMFTIIIFCLPYSMPAEVETFNWSSVLIGGVLFLITVLWAAWGYRNFEGPPGAFEGTVVEAIVREPSVGQKGTDTGAEKSNAHQTGGQV